MGEIFKHTWLNEDKRIGRGCPDPVMSVCMPYDLYLKSFFKVTLKTPKIFLMSFYNQLDKLFYSIFIVK